MITTFKVNIDQTGAKVFTDENDQYGAQATSGAVGYRREKRDGRNPSTGARGSRPSGIAVTFVTGYLPLTTTEKRQIL